ncbi:MAG: ATP-binding protein [archaeon]
MNNEEIKEYLVDFQKRDIPKLIERRLKILDSKKIKSIIGPRRAGKTFFIYQKIKEILKTGVSKENIIYLNFEDTRLISINFKEIRDIIKLQWQLFPSSTKGEFYVFIDEPQNIEKWEHAVRALSDEGFNIFLTGSSSKLLSKEIATHLRGRTLSYLLLPFSFKEFLLIKEFNSDINKLGSKEKAILLSLLDEYFEYGGFPEVILGKNETKLKILDNYFNLIVYRDIVDRYKIKNTKLIKWLINSLISSFSSEVSINKIYLTLKSQGFKLSKNTLYLYLSLLEDSFFIFLIPKFDYSTRKREFSINKSYLSDIGFSKLTEFSKDKGRKMENIVFLELERRKAPLTEIYYWKNQQQEEVDFVIKEGKVKELIQVCYNLDNSKDREIRALLKASKELKCNNLTVITENKEGEEKISNKKIKFIPLWKWLLV